MDSTISITLAKRERERLIHLALRYGFSLEELSSRILKHLAATIPEESFDDYENPQELRRSFARALRDWRAGRVQTRI